MDLSLISVPLTQAQKLAVVSVPEVKRQVRVLESTDDIDVQMADDIEAAYDFLAGPEGWLGRCCLLEQEYEWLVGGPGSSGFFELPMRPYLSANTIAFDVMGSDGTYAEVDTSFFYVARESAFAFGEIRRVGLSLWPYSALPHQQAYRVRFKAGFGTTRASIPSPLRKAIKLLAAHWWKNRETTGAEGRSVSGEILYGLRTLAGRYRVHLDHS
jgi:uncharacterized phiE125 gp8 family phage protein